MVRDHMAAMTTQDIALELRQELRGITRQEYDTLVDAGHLWDEKIELLRGMIVEMSPKGLEHDDFIEWLNMFLVKRLPERLHLRVQSAFAASEDSQPEPDIAVVPADWPRHELRSHVPIAELIIEVSATSLRKDLIVKSTIYAENGVDTYWVIDVAAREVVVHTTPIDGQYTSVRRVASSEVIDAVGIEVPLADMFAFAIRES